MELNDTLSPHAKMFLFVAGLLALVPGEADLQGGEPLPLSSAYWRDASFQKSFNGSYRIEARIEPSVTTGERGLLVEVQGLMEKGQRKTALSKVEGSALTKTSAALQFNLANLQFEEGNLDGAIKAYESAIDLYPSFRRAHRNLAMALVRDGSLDEALGHLIEAMRLGDADGATFGLLGYCRLQREEWESALQAYRMAQLTQPDAADWKAGVAQCLQHLEAHAEAVAILDEVIRQRPGEPSYAVLQASVLIGLERPEDAVKALELPRRLGRLDSSGLLLLADLHLRAERSADAKTSISEAFERLEKPETDRILSVVASAMRTREWGLASQLLEGADPAVAAGARDLRLASARLQIESEKAPETGAQELRKLLTEDPTDGRVLMALARYEGARGNSGEAELFFERATADVANAADAWVELARLRVDQRRYGGALKAIGEALVIRPGGELEEYRQALTRLVEAAR